MNKTELIFLISLPRSGSTLLQHILGNHSDIIASAEPWVLFPHLLTLRQNTFYAKYQPEIGRIALTDFLVQIDGNEQVYYEGVRKYADYLYSAFLRKTGKRIFLDKTSRYYLALPELYKVYPDAKYIFLLRNPLSILASFIENMVDGNLKALGRDGIREDLLDGYKILGDQISNDKINSISLQYESLIENPNEEVKKLCRFLGVKFEPTMIHYGGENKIFYGKLVDRKSIHKHQEPVKKYLNTWDKILDNDERRNFAISYLRYLGAGLLERTGYNYEELLSRCNYDKNDKRVNDLFNQIMIKRKNGVSSRVSILEAISHFKAGNFKLALFKISKMFINQQYK